MASATVAVGGKYGVFPLLLSFFVLGGIGLVLALGDGRKHLAKDW